MSVNRSATRLRRGLLPAIVLALFLLLVARLGPAAALGGAPPGPPQVISAGGFHTCALTPTSGADCWGFNGAGQAADQTGPYTQVTTGSSHTCALTPAGAADCWGLNDNGQASDQTGPYSQLSAGGTHTCALTPAGAADCWGFNNVGQAADQPGPYIQVSARGYHTCALTSGGAADCWGHNNTGQANDQPGPYTQVSAGYFPTCALTPAGAADCWGSNNNGEADDQTGPYSQLSGGGTHTCALTPAGAADCWGDNGLGQAADQTGPYRPNDPFELDNSPGQATEVAIGQTYRNNFIRSPGDVDFYTFYAETGFLLIIEVEAQAIGSDLDPVLTLYDADGTTVLAENDDYGSYDSRIAFSVPSDGYYFLRVRDYDDPDEGGPGYFYNLSLRVGSLYFSSTKAGTMGGVAATPQDIVA